MKDYRDKLKKLSQQPLWKIILFTLAVNITLHYYRIKDFYFYLNANLPRLQRRFIPRSHTRLKAHYIRIHKPMPDRLAFLALACLCTVGIIQLESHIHTIYWAIGWGIAFASFTLYLAVRMVFKALRANGGARR